MLACSRLFVPKFSKPKMSSMPTNRPEPARESAAGFGARGAGGPAAARTFTEEPLGMLGRPGRRPALQRGAMSETREGWYPSPTAGAAPSMVARWRLSFATIHSNTFV